MPAPRIRLCPGRTGGGGGTVTLPQPASAPGAASATPFIAVVGWKNSGKTTLIAKLVSELCRRGYRVATVKHAHHHFDIDHEGTDSYRHRAAGAVEVALVSRRRWAILHELGEEGEPGLSEILAKLAPADLVIIEGYKEEAIPKIEVRRRAAARTDPLAPGDPHIVAVAADHVADGTGRPVFDLDAVAAIATFIIAHLGIAARAGAEALAGK